MATQQSLKRPSSISSSRFGNKEASRPFEITSFRLVFKCSFISYLVFILLKSSFYAPYFLLTLE